MRLAPQPRSLVGAQCALEETNSTRTPHRRRPTTGGVSFDHECTPRDWSRLPHSWQQREHMPRFLRRVRASCQSSECRGSARAPPRHDRRTRTSVFSASRRCVARSLTWPNGQPRYPAEARMPACRLAVLGKHACCTRPERGPPIPTRGSYGPPTKISASLVKQRSTRTSGSWSAPGRAWLPRAAAHAMLRMRCPKASESTNLTAAWAWPLRLGRFLGVFHGVFVPRVS